MVGTLQKWSTARRTSGICGAIALVSGFVGVHVALASNVGRAPGARAAFASMPISMPTPTPAIDPACQPVFDASDKMLTVPNHSYITRTAPGSKTSVSETISIDGARYVMVGGKEQEPADVSGCKGPGRREQEEREGDRVQTCGR